MPKQTPSKKQPNTSMALVTKSLDIASLVSAALFVMTLTHNIQNRQLIILIQQSRLEHPFAGVGGVGLDAPVHYFFVATLALLAVRWYVGFRTHAKYFSTLTVIALAILLTGAYIWFLALHGATQNQFQASI